MRKLCETRVTAMTLALKPGLVLRKTSFTIREHLVCSPLSKS